MKKVLCVLAAIMLVTLCGTAFAASAVDKDTIIVGTEGTYPPFEFHDKSGALVGYDIDLVDAVAAKMGKKVKWVDMAFDGLIPALMTNKIVSFSDAYLITYSAFVTLKDDDRIKGVSDLAGKKVSVQLGTTEDLYVSTVEGVDVKKFSKLDDAIREISLGRVDAAFMDEPVARDYISSEQFKGKLQIAFTVELEGAPKAIAVNKSDTKLLDAVNKALKEIKDDGTLETINKKWNQH